MSEEILAIYRKLDTRDVIRSGMVSFHFITHRLILTLFQPIGMYDSPRVYEGSPRVVGPTTESRHEKSCAHARDPSTAFLVRGGDQTAHDTPGEAAHPAGSGTMST